MGDAVIARGMTSVYTGLGILLGAGKISSATHEQILALINSDDSALSPVKNGNGVKTAPNGQNQTGKDTPNSFQSTELETDMGNLKVGGRSSCGPGPSFSSNSSKFGGENQWGNGLPPPTSQKGDATDPRRSNIVCPWWSTNGYRCREQEKGQCAWIHEETPDGIKDPLICSFWADGQRCNKSDNECRFAHFWAQHRQIAPAPNMKWKKTKRDTTSNDSW